MYLQEQKLNKVEEEFARAIGIPVDEKKMNESASIISTLKERLSKKRPQKIICTIISMNAF